MVNDKTFKQATFVKSATKLSQCPPSHLPEVAVVGRSNVGKSSLINNLLQRKGLAKTSSTPGKTQLINFFDLSEELMLVDLPGYGYARVGHSTRETWKDMIEGYLTARDNLKLILFLFDIRREPNADDFAFLEWADYHKRPVAIILTKVDKIAPTKRSVRVKLLKQLFEMEEILLFSTLKNIGRDALRRTILNHLNETNHGT